jgi:hypothetical protein
LAVCGGLNPPPGIVRSDEDAQQSLGGSVARAEGIDLRRPAPDLLAWANAVSAMLAN